jgi:hypothetical protein
VLFIGTRFSKLHTTQWIRQPEPRGAVHHSGVEPACLHYVTGDAAGTAMHPLRILSRLHVYVSYNTHPGPGTLARRNTRRPHTAKHTAHTPRRDGLHLNWPDGVLIATPWIVKLSDTRAPACARSCHGNFYFVTLVEQHWTTNSPASTAPCVLRHSPPL